MDETVEETTTEEAPESAETKNADTEIQIPKSRFDEVLAKNKELTKLVEARESEQKQAQEKALEEQGKFKELYETAQADARRVEEELFSLRHDSLRQQIATDAGYPTLWNRISGDDKDALEADMTTLIAALPKAQAPKLDGGTGSGARTTEEKTMSKADRAYLASVLGVNEEYLPK